MPPPLKLRLAQSRSLHLVTVSAQPRGEFLNWNLSLSDGAGAALLKSLRISYMFPLSHRFDVVKGSVRSQLKIAFLLLHIAA